MMKLLFIIVFSVLFLSGCQHCEDIYKDRVYKRQELYIVYVKHNGCYGCEQLEFQVPSIEQMVDKTVELNSSENRYSSSSPSFVAIDKRTGNTIYRIVGTDAIIDLIATNLNNEVKVREYRGQRCWEE